MQNAVLNLRSRGHNSVLYQLSYGALAKNICSDRSMKVQFRCWKLWLTDRKGPFSQTDMRTRIHGIVTFPMPLRVIIIVMMTLETFVCSIWPVSEWPDYPGHLGRVTPGNHSRAADLSNVKTLYIIFYLNILYYATIIGVCNCNKCKINSMFQSHHFMGQFV